MKHGQIGIWGLEISLKLHLSLHLWPNKET